jgi:hypothetical protein
MPMFQFSKPDDKRVLLNLNGTMASITHASS